jgi:hypothetical protein
MLIRPLAGVVGGGHVQFFKLPRLNTGGSAGEQAPGLLGLGKGDDIANGIFPCQQHHQPIQSVGNTPVRWGAVLKGF